MDGPRTLHSGPLDGLELRHSVGVSASLYFGWEEWENGTVWRPENQLRRRKAVYHFLRGAWQYIRTEKIK